MKQKKRVKRRAKITHLEASAWYRPSKQQVSLRLDADALAWLTREGGG